MIRRLFGNQFLLFTQHDHALLSGRFAAHLGNNRFAPPQPRDAVVDAIARHDAGWPTHDDHPTLNKDGQPLDVFETPLKLALKIWTASADRAAETQSDYTQLLVSLHGLGLSGFAASHAHTRHETFELNKFQQREIERQEALRRRLSLPTTIPLRLGLAEGSNLPREEENLRRNFHLLQLMDRLSLAFCSTEIPFPRVDNITAKPGARALSINLARTSDFSITLDPWPFDRDSLSFEVPYRSLPAKPFPDEKTFQQAYAAAPSNQMLMTAHAKR
jgi:hypothetical protein